MCRRLALPGKSAARENELCGRTSRGSSDRSQPQKKSASILLSKFDHWSIFLREVKDKCAMDGMMGGDLDEMVDFHLIKCMRR